MNDKIGLPFILMPEFQLFGAVMEKLKHHISEGVVQLRQLLLKWYLDGSLNKNTRLDLMDLLQDLINTIMSEMGINKYDVLKCGLYENEKNGYGSYLFYDQPNYVVAVELFDEFVGYLMTDGVNSDSGLPNLHHAVYSLWKLYNIVEVEDEKKE